MRFFWSLQIKVKNFKQKNLMVGSCIRIFGHLVCNMQPIDNVGYPKTFIGYFCCSTYTVTAKRYNISISLLFSHHSFSIKPQRLLKTDWPRNGGRRGESQLATFNSDERREIVNLAGIRQDNKKSAVSSQTVGKAKYRVIDQHFKHDGWWNPRIIE